jgi:MFS family permease
MISYWLNYGFFFVTQYGSFQWRFPLAFQAVFAIILFFGVVALPESPRWLLKHDKDEVAVEILTRLKRCPPEDPIIQEEVAQIKKIKEITDGKKLTLKEFYGNGPEMNRWRVTIGYTSQLFQQIGGTNLVTYYATTVFEDSLGFSPALSRLLTACYGTLYLMAAIAALFIVDRYGRRRMLIIGSVGMGTSAMVIVRLFPFPPTKWSTSTNTPRAPASLNRPRPTKPPPTSPPSSSSSSSPSSPSAGSASPGCIPPRSPPSASAPRPTASPPPSTGSATTPSCSSRPS